MTTFHLVRGQDNEIQMTLLESASPINPTWIELEIDIGGVVTITRTNEVNGITFSNGIVGITAGKLTEDLSGLYTPWLYPGYVTVKTASDPNGVVYGASDSGNLIWFYVTDPV